MYGYMASMPTTWYMTMADARLFYVVGASGSGKDSLIDYARKHVKSDTPVIFAHRYITRPYNAGGENHIELGEEEFEMRRQRGCFALHWKSHGLQYAIGIEINQWLAKGIHVVVNGSRAYMPYARIHYPEILPVLIRVHPDKLRERLQNRDRENEQEIEERIHQAEILDRSLNHANLAIIENNHSLDESGNTLVRMIESRKVLQCA